MIETTPNHGSRARVCASACAILFACALALAAPATADTEEESAGFQPSVSLHGRVQGYWKMTGGDQSGLEDGYKPDHDGFRIYRWRLGASAEVFEHVEVQVEVGETENRREHDVNVLDANIRLTYFDFANLIVGAQKTPVSRNHMTSSRQLEFILRPVLSDQIFVPTEETGKRNGVGLPDRDVGLQLRGSIHDGFFKYYAGIFNGQGEFFDDNWNGKYAYTARLELNPLGDFSRAPADFGRELKVGVGGSFFSNRGYDAKYMGWGADVDLRGYGASLQAEWLRSEAKPDFNDGAVDPVIKEKTYRDGWYVQGGFFVWPSYVQLVARYEEFDDNSHLEDEGDIKYTTVGGNWYIQGNNDYKLQINYIWREEEGKEIDNNALMALLQVAF